MQASSGLSCVLIPRLADEKHSQLAPLTGDCALKTLLNTTARGRLAAGRAGLALLVLAAPAGRGAFGAPPPLSVPTSSQTNPDGSPAYSGLLGDLNRTNFLLGNMFGVRTALSKYGISLAIQETSEALGNATGGVRRGIAYDGLTQAILQLDTQRGFGWYGGLLNISALQTHGRNLSSDNLLTLQTASGIEADRSTRLWEAWYDQKLLPEDRLDIKIGQQSVDQEFIYSANGAYFVNTMFGWPLVPSVDLPGGGPAYPLSDLGIRLRYRPVNALNILVGVFSGNPAPTDADDSQRSDASGISFPLNRGTLGFVELQYTYPAIGAMEYPGEGAPLGHTYRVGMWYDTDSFSDQRIGTDGLSLASLASNGMPLQHRGNYSIYAVADQMVWRQASDPNHSVSVFGRVMGTPEGDRNLVDFSLNAGVVLHEPFVNRADDTVALGMGFAHLSPQVTAYDRDVAAYTHLADPNAFTAVRSTETYVELTYQYQVHPWWQLQPDVQYVINPGGGIVNPADPGQRVGNELVLGLRTNILF
jgi:porin